MNEKIEKIDLGKVFDENALNVTWGELPAMTKETFIRVVSELLEKEAVEFGEWLNENTTAVTCGEFWVLKNEDGLCITELAYQIFKQKSNTNLKKNEDEKS